MTRTTWSLNWLHQARQMKRKDENVAVSRKPTAHHAAALKQLDLYIIDFLKGPPIPGKDWNEMMRRTQLDYQQQEVKIPEPVTWEQLEPARPPAESAGRVRAADRAEGIAKQWLADHHRCLLDETESPVAPRRAKVWVQSQDEQTNGNESLTAAQKEASSHFHGEQRFFTQEKPWFRQCVHAEDVVDLSACVVFCCSTVFSASSLPFRPCMEVPCVSPALSSVLLTQVLRPRTGKVTTSKCLRVTVSTVFFVGTAFAVGFTLGVASVVCINPFSEGLVGLASGRVGNGLAGYAIERIIRYPLNIDVTLGSDGGGSSRCDSDVLEGPSLDPEDW